jgi:hypothetical protein
MQIRPNALAPVEFPHDHGNIADNSDRAAERSNKGRSTFGSVREIPPTHTGVFTPNNVDRTTYTKPAPQDEHVRRFFRPEEHMRFYPVSKDQRNEYQPGALSRAYQREKEARGHAWHGTNTTTPGTVLSEIRPELSYLEQVQLQYPDSATHEDGPRFVLDTLASIPVIGPRITGVGLPSGHSGIDEDPVLAQYNKDKRIWDIRECHRDHLVNQQRQLEEQQRQFAEQQRQAAEREAARLRNIAIFKHYDSKYCERVKKLMQFGPAISAEKARLVQAFQSGDLPSLGQASRSMIHNIIDPTCVILTDMVEEIPLEILGANHIKNAWPLDDIDSILNLLDRQTISQFNDGDAQATLGYMVQGFRNIHQVLSSAVAMQNTCAEPPVPVLPLNPIVPQQFQLSQQQYQVPQQQYQAPVQVPVQAPQAQVPPPVTANTSPPSFTEPTTAANGPSIRVTEPAMSGNADSNSAPAAATPTTSTSSLADRNRRMNLKACILEEYANFKGNVARLVVQAKVKHSPRQYITETLQELVKSAGGVTGVLTAGDDADMKAEIASLQRKIASLGQAEKNHKKTREMDVLAVRALELWV